MNQKEFARKMRDDFAKLSAKDQQQVCELVGQEIARATCGVQIATMLNKRGLSIKDFADKYEYDVEFIADICYGKTHEGTSLAFLYEVAELLEFDLDLALIDLQEAAPETTTSPTPK